MPETVGTFFITAILALGGLNLRPYTKAGTPTLKAGCKTYYAPNPHNTIRETMEDHGKYR